MSSINDPIETQRQSFKVQTNVTLTSAHLKRIMKLVHKKLESIPKEMSSKPLTVKINLESYHSNALKLNGSIQVQEEVEDERESSIIHDSFEEQTGDLKEEEEEEHKPPTTLAPTSCIYPLCTSPQSHNVYNCWSIRRICSHCGKSGHESVHHQFASHGFLCFLADDVMDDLPFMEEKVRSYLTSTKELLSNCNYPLCLFSFQHSMSNCWARRRNCTLCGRNGHDSTHHQFISNVFLEYITGC